MTTTAQPLPVTGSARASVEVALRRLVATGAYAPGDRLPSERALSDQLGISRNVVREAIRRLLEIGVLESRDRSGLYLAVVDMDEVFATRLLIEPACARSAALHHSRQDAVRLDRLRRRLLASTDAATVAELDAEVHLAIAAAGHNAVVHRIMLGLHDLVAFSRAAQITEYLVDHDGLGQMDAIVEQILRRDPDAAEAAMRAHVEECATSSAAQRAALDNTPRLEGIDARNPAEPRRNVHPAR